MRISMFFLLVTLASQGLAEVGIFNVTVTNINDTSAVVSWHTTVPSSGSVFFGEMKDMLHNQSVSIAVSTQHLVALNRLKPGSEYHFYIKAKFEDNAIPQEYTQVRMFRTTGSRALAILSCDIKDPFKDRFTVAWSTSIPSFAKLVYLRDGTRTAFFSSNSSSSLSGYITVSNLESLAPYLYFLECRDENANVTRTGIKRHTTSEDNLALGKPVQGTFTNRVKDFWFSTNGRIIDRITDGQLSYFTGLAVSGSIRGSDQWCQIDLGRQTKAGRVLVYWRSLAYSTNFSILLSRDGLEWTRVCSNVNPSKGQSMRGDKGDPVVMNDLAVPPLPFRFLKLVAARNAARLKHPAWDHLQLMEIKVYPIERTRR